MLTIPASGAGAPVLYRRDLGSTGPRPPLAAEAERVCDKMVDEKDQDHAESPVASTKKFFDVGLGPLGRPAKPRKVLRGRRVGAPNNPRLLPRALGWGWEGPR